MDELLLFCYRDAYEVNEIKCCVVGIAKEYQAFFINMRWFYLQNEFRDRDVLST